MTPTQRAQAAGWFYWFGDWYSTDVAAIVALEHPPCWRGTARDLCLAHGLAFGERTA